MTSYALNAEGRFVGARRQLLAPAKLNLGLAVGTCQDDGYHEIRSVLQAVDLCDVIEAELIFESNRRYTDSTVEVEAPGVEGGDTIVTRAALAYAKAVDICLHARIHIAKQIPAGAGLGGGSSDAGAVLRFANDLCESPLTHAKLVDVAASVGSDIPFFLSGSGSAYVSGRGELVHEAAIDPRWWIVVVPPIHCDTAAVYSAFTQPSKSLPGKDDLLSAAQTLSEAQSARNDLQEAAFDVAPDLRDIRNAITRCGISPSLSGSGSAMFVPASGDITQRTAAVTRLSEAVAPFGLRGDDIHIVHSCGIDGSEREPVR